MSTLCPHKLADPSTVHSPDGASHLLPVWTRHVYCEDMFFNTSRAFKGKSVHYDRFSTLLFSVEALSTYQARIYAGKAP